MPSGCPIVDSVCKIELENIRDEFSGRRNFNKHTVMCLLIEHPISETFTRKTMTPY